MERAFGLLKPTGFNAQINMQSWMFLSSYEKLREWLLKNFTIITMAHLGTRAFDSIGGEAVSTTAFGISHQAYLDYQGAYIRLVEGRSEAEKNALGGNRESTLVARISTRNKLAINSGKRNHQVW